MEGRRYARSLDELHDIMNLMPRNCVQCDDTAELSCPTCPKGKMCQYTVPTDDCSECSQAICVTDPSAVDDPDSVEGGGDTSGDDDGGPNVGAIAGGVIGGLVVIALITYLAWRYLIRPRRAEEAARQSAYGGSINPQDSEKDGASRMTRRSSTHTVHSIASTVLTRASNIIQIAYIPGVTNRANQSSSGVLVPPVPPIPMQHSGQQQHNGAPGQDEQHFFVPGDLRDSTYSGLSGYSDRTSYATRTSYAPRSSIASTIYGKQAQVMTPASTGLRAKPTMVSVKSNGSGGSDGYAPPVPEIDFQKFGNGRPKSGASTFSVGSTFLNTATQARAQVVKVGGLKQVSIPAKSGSTTPEGGSTRDSPEGTTPIASPPPAVLVNGSPFDDPRDGATTPTTPGLKSVSTPTLGALMEDEAEDNSSNHSKRPTSLERGSSPFGDEHATK